MTTRPTTHNRQFNGNAYWKRHMGWVMPSRINKGPSREDHIVGVTELIPPQTRRIHRALRFLMQQRESR